MEAIKGKSGVTFATVKPYLKVALAIIIGLVALAAIVNGSLSLHDLLSKFNWAGKAGSISMTVVGSAVLLTLIGGIIYITLKSSTKDEDRKLKDSEILSLMKKLPVDKAFVYRAWAASSGVIVAHKESERAFRYYSYLPTDQGDKKEMTPGYWFHSLESKPTGTNRTPYSEWADKLLSIDEVSKMQENRS